MSQNLLLLPSLCLNHLPHLCQARLSDCPPHVCVPGPPTGSWTPPTGRGECGWRRGAKWPTWNWKTKSLVSKRQSDGRTDRQGSAIVYCHCIVSSSSPSLVLICSKVTQQPGYFEPQRLTNTIRLFCLLISVILTKITTMSVWCDFRGTFSPWPQS